MSLYTVLNVSENATLDEIRRAYRREALRTHPDKHPPEKRKEAEAQFKKVAEAYQILSDPEKRRRYDCSKDVTDVAAFNSSNSGYNSFDAFGTFASFFGRDPYSFDANEEEADENEDIRTVCSPVYQHITKGSIHIGFGSNASSKASRTVHGQSVVTTKTVSKEGLRITRTRTVSRREDGVIEIKNERIEEPDGILTALSLADDAGVKMTAINIRVRKEDGTEEIVLNEVKEEQLGLKHTLSSFFSW